MDGLTWARLSRPALVAWYGVATGAEGSWSPGYSTEASPSGSRIWDWTSRSHGLPVTAWMTLPRST